MVHLDHLTVTSLPARFCYETASRRYDQIAAFAVDVHPGVKLVNAAAEWITPETELVVDLAQMCPDRRNVFRYRCCLDRFEPCLNRGVLDDDVVR